MNLNLGRLQTWVDLTSLTAARLTMQEVTRLRSLDSKLAPQSGIEPPYYALRPLRLINSQVSYQLEYRGI